jgi:hypothetical protein
MNRLFIGIFIVLLIGALNLSSCAVDISGAPCDPQKDNCPKGQYCSEEGVCKYGSKDVNIIPSDTFASDVTRDIISKDYSDIEDIYEDVSDIQDISDAGDIEDFEDNAIDVIEGDVTDAISDVADTGDISDVIYDGNCINVCNPGESKCITGNSLIECQFNGQTGCYEWSDEIVCNTPPSNTCVDSQTLRIYNQTGECLQDSCQYNSYTITCKNGCENGKCKDCKPDCTNKECGDDGCGGICGVCGDNASCSSNYKCECIGNYLNCNNDWKDGCEINKSNDLNNCGKCNNKCTVLNGTPKCENGKCAIESCYSRYGDCDNKYETGCEEYLDKVNRCGDCNTDCTKLGWQHVSEYKCSDGFNNFFCNISMCENNYANCDGILNTGCETNISNDRMNCGKCGFNCGQNTNCTEGKCYCITDYGNCNNDWSDGCETSGVNSNNEKCGPECKVCTNYTQYCASGNCTDCPQDYNDCDDNAANGCEANLKSDIFNCGSCGINCQKNVRNADGIYCNNGRCDYTSCKIGWEDLDDGRENGCESWNYFPKIYGTSNLEEGKSIAGFNGGYLIAGSTTINSNRHIVVIKLESHNGKVVWSKEFGEGAPARLLAEKDKDGNLSSFIIAGYIIGQNFTGKDLFVLRVNPDGSILNSFFYQTAADEEATDIIRTSDGGFAVLGIQNNTLSKNDIILIKLKSDLTSSWGVRYFNGDGTSNQSDEFAYSIKEDIINGKYIIAGSTSNKSGDALILRVESDNGDIDKAVSFGGTGGDYLNSINIIPNGFLVGGFTNSFGNGSTDILIAKIDISLQNINLAAAIGGLNTEKPASIIPSPDNAGFIVVGLTNSFSAGGYDGFALKIDNAGQIAWQRTYGGNNGDYITDIIPTMDNGYIAIGGTNSFGYSSYEMWVINTDKYGEVMGSCPAGLPGISNFKGLSINNLVISDYNLNSNGLTIAPIAISINARDITIYSNMQCSAPQP